jgi:HK97 family phage portal protein
MNRDTGGYFFQYDSGSGKDYYPSSDVWHIPGISMNGAFGISVIAHNREALGLSVATTQFGNAFFGNGAWAGGFLTSPLGAPELSPAKAEEFLASINEKFRGASKAFGLGFLREGIEFKQLDMPMEDAMFLDTRKFQRVEICGMFDVPPIMIQDTEKSTYSNTEQADIAFAKHSILKRLRRIESSAKQTFFKNTKLSLKFNLSGLERGDFKTRHEGYNIGRNGGWYSINDIRAMEDMNPIENGDTYLEPLNMWPVGQPRPVPTQQQAAAVETVTIPHSYPATSVESAVIVPPLVKVAIALDAKAIIMPPLKQVAEEIAVRQCKAAKTAWIKHARDGRTGSFSEWADKFFVQHAEVFCAKLEPIIESLIAATGEKAKATAEELAGELCREWQLQMTANDIAAGEIIEQWKVGLADEITSHICEILFNVEDNTDD